MTFNFTIFLFFLQQNPNLTKRNFLYKLNLNPSARGLNRD